VRVSFWDKWKGAAIIAVVLIHASSSTSYYPSDSFNNDFGIILRQFINFPVGLFIFLAAFFVARSQRSSETYWENVTRRVWRLALPFLIWSIIYCTLRLLSGSLAIEDIPLMFLNGTSVSVGYFVIVMIQMSIISPVLERLTPSQLAKFLPLSLVLSLGFTYSVKLIYPASFLSEFPYYPLPFFVWLPFYIGGLILGRKSEEFWKSINVRVVLGSFFICVCLSLIEAMLFLQEIRSFATSQLKFTSILTTGIVCIMVVASWVYGKDNKENMLSWLGQRSFYFYLSHMLVLGQVQNLFQPVNLLHDNQITFVLTSTLATLGITSLGAFILDSLLSSASFYRRALGLS
jgi:surface polysaccharide O-acyltransferase-like enzyme